MSKLLNLGVVAAFVFAASLPVTSFAQDSEVTSNFKQVGRALRGFNSLEGQELADAMRETRQHLAANTGLTPSVLEGSSAADVAEFQRGVAYALGMYDAAIGLAEEGHSDAAKAILSAITDVRDNMHDRYDVGN